MPSHLETDLQCRGPLTYLRLAGMIDETHGLADLLSQIRGDVLIIDLAHIQSISSSGVREWMQWQRQLHHRVKHVVLCECSPAVMDKLQAVSNFNERGYISSFYVRFFCPVCEIERAALIDIDEIKNDGTFHVPDTRCDSCDSMMAFDESMDAFSLFVRELGRFRPPKSLKKHLSQAMAAVDDRKLLSYSYDGARFSNILPMNAPNSGLTRVDLGSQKSRGYPSGGGSGELNAFRKTKVHVRREGRFLETASWGTLRRFRWVLWGTFGLLFAVAVFVAIWVHVN